MSINIADAFFSGFTSCASLALFAKFFTDERPKGPVPIHFNWYGEGDNTVKNAKMGALIYPAIVLGMSLVPFFGRQAQQIKRDRALMQIEQENAAKTNRFGATGAFLRAKVMPWLNAKFFTRTSTVLILALQHKAHQISLGLEEKVSTIFIRPLVLGYVGIMLSHWGLGTMKLM